MKRKRLRKGSQRLTVADIAEAASVSTATVSRFLNNPESVRPERAERVRSAITALGYVRHGAARTLASHKSMSIGAVIPTLDNAIFAKGIQAFQKRLHVGGYTLLLGSFDYDPVEEIRQATALIEHGVDGMLLIGLDHRPELFTYLDRVDVPYVSSWAYDPEQPHPCVGFDNLDAARRLTTYLLEIGHRRIGMVAGVTQYNDRARERAMGAREALSAHGLMFDPDLYLESPYTIRAGRHAMRNLMERSPRPTAVICGNDVIAMGALLECQSLGIAVPDEVSVTGFDDLPMVSQLRPALTTVHVPSEEMGQRAADHLLARIQGKTILFKERLDTEVVIRGTTAPPKRDN